jgi:hypothetical protein
LWFVALSLIFVAAGDYWQAMQRSKPMFLRGENKEADAGRPPVDGDYWAIRLGYAGDPQNMRFEPRWLLDSAVQDRRIASNVPVGTKTYARSADRALALDPNAFTLLGPQPLQGEGFGIGSNAGRTNVIMSDLMIRRSPGWVPTAAASGRRRTAARSPRPGPSRRISPRLPAWRSAT